MSDNPIEKAIASLPDEPLAPERQNQILRLAQTALEAEKSKFARFDHFMMDKLMPLALSTFVIWYGVGLVSFLKRTYMNDGNDQRAAATEMIKEPSAPRAIIASAD